MFKGIKLKVVRKEGSVFHQHISCVSANYSALKNSFECALLRLSQILEFSASVIFSLHMLWRIFSPHQPDTQEGWYVCTNEKYVQRCFPDLADEEAHYPWNIPKENRRDLHIMNSCCEQDTENNKYSGYWERFRCREDISGWIFLTPLGFYFFSSFPSSSNNNKKRRKREQLSGDICPYVVLIFVFTLLYSTL